LAKDIFRVYKGCVWATSVQEQNLTFKETFEVNTAKTWEMHSIKNISPFPPVLSQNIYCKCIDKKCLGQKFHNYWDLQQKEVKLPYKLWQDKGSCEWTGNQEKNEPLPPESIVTCILFFSHKCKERKAYCFGDKIVEEGSKEKLLLPSKINDEKLRQSGLFNGNTQPMSL
jgi:hypothetical protein